MRRLEAGDVTYLAGGQSGIVEILIADAGELGADFPFEELSDEEVREVYGMMGWWRYYITKDPALLRLRQLVRDGEKPYIFMDVGWRFLLDFGDESFNLDHPLHVCDVLLNRQWVGNLRMDQITPHLAEVARQGREIYYDYVNMPVEELPESRRRVEELRRWLFQEGA